MKHSVKKIFRNISIFMCGISLFAVIFFLAAFLQERSNTKIDILNNQKKTASSILELEKNSTQVMLIELDGKSKQLSIEIEKLYTLYENDFIEKHLLSGSQEYMQDLNELSSSSTLLGLEAVKFYEKEDQSDFSAKNELEKRVYSFNKKIDSIITKAVACNQTRINIQKYIALSALIYILAGLIWYGRRLEHIYRDLEFLYLINHEDKKYSVFSEEANAISHRIDKKQTIIQKDLSMLDPVTELNNLKGMISSYAEKKGMRDDNFTSLCIIEIDNFSLENKIYSQELTQTILKKIAYIISLHEQASDIIARTDYNQFSVILCRAKKEEAFKEIDDIRKSISELKINSQELKDAKITVSGGYIIKPNNISLEEALLQAKKVLKHAKQNGKNKISQIKDLAEAEL